MVRLQESGAASRTFRRCSSGSCTEPPVESWTTRSVASWSAWTVSVRRVRSRLGRWSSSRMCTWIIAAPAASHSRAVVTSSSRVVGSWGQSALVVSAPVGATVTRRASDGTVMASSCQRACGLVLRRPSGGGAGRGCRARAPGARRRGTSRGCWRRCRGWSRSEWGGASRWTTSIVRLAPKPIAVQSVTRRRSEEQAADEAEGHEHHDVEGELDLGGVDGDAEPCCEVDDAGDGAAGEAGVGGPDEVDDPAQVDGVREPEGGAELAGHGVSLWGWVGGWWWLAGSRYARRGGSRRLLAGARRARPTGGPLLFAIGLLDLRGRRGVARVRGCVEVWWGCWRGC